MVCRPNGDSPNQSQGKKTLIALLRWLVTRNGLGMQSRVFFSTLLTNQYFWLTFKVIHRKAITAGTFHGMCHKDYINLLSRLVFH